MSTHPYIPLYVDDYEAATAHLTAEEDGIYSRLLRLCWRTPGCSLPNDPAWIARKIRISESDYERVAKPVIADFFRVSRGRLIQKRLKAEYDLISRKKSARVRAGKMGGSAKARNNKPFVASNDSDLPAHTRAFPEPKPEPEKNSDDKSSDAIRVVVDHDRDAWAQAVTLLSGQGGLTEKQARPFFGRLLSANGLEPRDLLPSLAKATVSGTQDPQSYLTKAAALIAKRRDGPAKPKRVSWV